MISIFSVKKLTLISLLAITQQAIAQTKWSRFEVGAGISGYIYQGDLTTHRLGSIETIKPGFLVFGNYKLKDQLSLQASFSMGKLKGSDAKYSKPSWRQERNFLFTTPVKEVALKVNYSIFKNYQSDQSLLFPYIAAGVGVGFFNIKKDYSNLSSKLTNSEPRILAGLAIDNSKVLPRVLVSVPVVLGVRKMYNERFDLFAEANYRFVFTDYLDGFSEAASSKRKDKFYSINVGAIYKFRKNNNLKCPTY